MRPRATRVKKRSTAAALLRGSGDPERLKADRKPEHGPRRGSPTFLASVPLPLFIEEDVVPALLRAGVTGEQVDASMIANPGGW